MKISQSPAGCGWLVDANQSQIKIDSITIDHRSRQQHEADETLLAINCNSNNRSDRRELGAGGGVEGAGRGKIRFGDTKGRIVSGLTVN